MSTLCRPKWRKEKNERSEGKKHTNGIRCSMKVFSFSSSSSVVLVLIFLLCTRIVSVKLIAIYSENNQIYIWYINTRWLSFSNFPNRISKFSASSVHHHQMKISLNQISTTWLSEQIEKTIFFYMACNFTHFAYVEKKNRCEEVFGGSQCTTVQVDKFSVRQVDGDDGVKEFDVQFCGQRATTKSNFNKMENLSKDRPAIYKLAQFVCFSALYLSKVLWIHL